MDAKAGLAILSLFVVGIVLAASVATYYQTANVVALPIITYMDDTPLEANATIDWGTLYAGTANEFNFTVYNNMTEAHTIYLMIQYLPAGWTQTWIGNGTLLQNQTGVSFPLVLTVPASAESKQYIWQHQIVTG